MYRPAINALPGDELATHMNRRSGGLRRPQSPTDFAFWTPKKHREFHSLTATSAMVLPSSAVRRRGWGSCEAEKRGRTSAPTWLPDEAALERAERLANLLTLSYEPMLAWRLDGPIEFWNAGAERLYGFAQDEAVGRTSHALLRTEFPIDFADLRSQLKDQAGLVRRATSHLQRWQQSRRREPYAVVQ